MVAFIASFAYAEEGVEITDAYTMDYRMELADVFEVWEPVMYNVDYTVTGSRKYNVVIIIKSMGDTLREVRKRVRAGSYTYLNTNLPRDDDVGTHTVTYNVKLKKGGLMDQGSTTSEITVIE
jgi:hypothetical protein